MCRIKAQPKWDDRLDAIPPLAGTLVAFISLLFVAITDADAYRRLWAVVSA